jgi:hypothetical protein
MKLFEVGKTGYPVDAADVVETKVDQIYSGHVLFVDAKKFALETKT